MRLATMSSVETRNEEDDIERKVGHGPFMVSAGVDVLLDA
jgi:hypothetical protein